jgi:hypothetical protein
MDDKLSNIKDVMNFQKKKTQKKKKEKLIIIDEI